MSTNKGTFVGLDIGSSAVRAAEMDVAGGRRVLRRFAQVDLPPGAVVDGEIVEVEVVSRALRQLWESGEFSTRRVVVGVSSQRVIVRPADVVAMPEADFRTALQFEAQELIPIPVDEAVLDFTILEPVVSTDDASGTAKMRILLAAAHKELLRSHLAAVEAAGLSAVAVDLVPLALLRATPVADEAADATDAVVSLGGELTTVAVRSGGVPRFTRTVNVGGAKLTNSLASEMSMRAADAEALKRDAAAGKAGTVLERTRALLREDMRSLVDEVAGSIDFFVAQSDRAGVDRVLLTGGAVRTPGIVDALASAISGTVDVVDPFAGLATDDAGMSVTELEELSDQALTAIGLALWGSEPPGGRIDLLPPEVRAKRRQKKLAIKAAAGLAGLVVVLAGVWVARDFQLHHAQANAIALAGGNSHLRAEVAALSDVTATESRINADRSLATKAAAGSVDWLGVLGQVAAVLPPDEALTTLTATPASSTSSSSASTAPGASAGIGTLQVTVVGTHGQESAAEWIRALDRLPALSGVWITSSSDAHGSDTFTSSASVTPAATAHRSLPNYGGRP